MVLGSSGGSSVAHGVMAILTCRGFRGSHFALEFLWVGIFSFVFFWYPFLTDMGIWKMYLIYSEFCKEKKYGRYFID